MNGRDEERSDTPLVSIVTPCYNAEPFVAETLASVAAQTYPRVEHIVVDDGSTDGSWPIIESHGDQVVGIRLERNGGGSRARNVGAARSRGDYLMFLDADDLIAPETIAALVDALSAAPNSLAYCPWRRLRWSDRAWVTAHAEIDLPDPAADPLRGWLEGRWVPPCSVLWTRAAFEATGGWDETISLNDDGDIMMRALARGARLVRATGGEALYRAHGGTRASVSVTTFTEEKLRSGLRVVEKIAEELESMGRGPEYASSIGAAYESLALTAFQQSHMQLGREFRMRAASYGSRRVVSRTAVGRLLTQVIGLERKERLVLALARVGIATPGRRATLQLRAEHGRGGGGDAAVDAGVPLERGG